MLRILLWRLFYHIFCLIKRMGLTGPKINYFAFGANLDPAILKQRNIKIYSRQEFILQDYCLRFNHSVPFKAAGMASIELCHNEKVAGVIYQISYIDSLRLDYYETRIVLKRYQRIYQTNLKVGQFYFYQTCHPKKQLSPPRFYLERLLRGYANISKIPPGFLESLRQTKTIPQLIPKEEPFFMVTNYDCLGGLANKILLEYDKYCLRLFTKWLSKPSFIEKQY